MVYSPSDDSFLLAREVQKYFESLEKSEKENIKVLDMGSGSGIQALTAINAGASKSNVLCADIDKEAIAELKKQNLSAAESDLYSNIEKSNRFNLIIFNAPYLPADKYDKKPDTTAGKKGNEIIIRFLKDSKPYLAEKGIILLLFSSLSKPKSILSQAKKLKYKIKKLSEENVGMMESLFVYKFCL